jgi:hypothetical protein
MSPGNGWVDLATPLATIKHEVQDVLSSTSISRPPSILASSKSTTLPKSSTVTSTLSPILSNLLISTTMNVQKKEMDTIVSKLDDTSLVFQEENSSPSFPEIGSEFSLRSKKNNDSINARATRFHSFSVPKRMLEVTSENNLMSTASTTLHEREDQEPIILLSRQKESKAQTSLPRYLQDTKSSSRYKKPNRSGSSSRTSRQGSSRTFENASKKELSGAVATNKIATKVKEITTMNAGLELAGLSESCNPKMAFNTFTTINSERPRTAPLSGGRSDDPPGIKLETLRVDTNSFGISHASLDTSLRMMSKSQAKGISIAPPRTTIQTQPRLIKTTWK